MVAGETLVEAALWKKARQRAVDAIDARHRRIQSSRFALTDLRAALEICACRGNIRRNRRRSVCEDSPLGQRDSPRGSSPRAVAAASIGQRANSRHARHQAVRSALAKNVAPDTASQQALRFLIESGEVFEVSSEIVLAAETPSAPPKWFASSSALRTGNRKRIAPNAG